MNKAVKKGLKMAGTALSTTVCALTLAYSQPATNVTKQTEPYSLEKAAGVYNDYIKRMDIVKNNNQIIYEEIKYLNDFLEKHLPHMPQVKKIVDYINENKEDEYVTQVVKDPTKLKEFRKIIKNLEEKVLIYFPNLVDKSKPSITYPSNQLLDQDHNQITKGLISIIDKFLQEKEDESLSRLTKKEQLTIQDLLAFYSILEKKKPLFGVETKTINKKQKQQPILYINILKHKNVYENFLNDVEEWKKGEGYCCRFISAGFRPYGGEIISSSQPGDIFDEELGRMFNCKIANIENQFPVKTLIPAWLGILLGLGAPVVIKGLITSYTRRKWDVGDGCEIIGSSMCSLIVDAVHPLVMPIRLFVLPVFTEVLFKNERELK